MDGGGAPAGVKDAADEGGGPAGVVDGWFAMLPNDSFLFLSGPGPPGVDGGLEETGTAKAMLRGRGHASRWSILLSRNADTSK